MFGTFEQTLKGYLDRSIFQTENCCPYTTRFSQSDADPVFSDGRKVSETVARLKGDPGYAEQIEPIRLVRYRDLPPSVQQRLAAQGANEHSVFSLDNGCD